MDHSGEALVGFGCAHGNAFEFFEFAEEIFDEMAPFVHFGVDVEWLGAAWMLRYDDFGAALIKVGNDAIAVKSLVGEQGTKLDTCDQWLNANRIKAMAWQQHEPDKIAQRIGQGEYLGRHAALGAAYGLILSPPFAPCP